MQTYITWGSERIKVTWAPGPHLPSVHLVTSVHGFCFLEGKVLMVDLKHRGFDIPGGHIEPGERPEECFRREALEEGYVRGGACTLLGYAEIDHSENPAWTPAGSSSPRPTPPACTTVGTPSSRRFFKPRSTPEHRRVSHDRRRERV